MFFIFRALCARWIVEKSLDGAWHSEKQIALARSLCRSKAFALKSRAQAIYYNARERQPLYPPRRSTQLNLLRFASAFSLPFSRLVYKFREHKTCLCFHSPEQSRPLLFFSLRSILFSLLNHFSRFYSSS